MAEDNPPADAFDGKLDAMFASGGEMAGLIAGHEWSASPIGPPGQWPSSLRNAVSLMLPAKAQIVLFWGPEFVALYNDAYAPTIGDKHPRAIGRPAKENWAELWGDLEPLLRKVLETGETIHATDRPFYIERHGFPETAFFDISYSAVLDEQGKPGGVLCIVSETTERVRTEVHLRESEARFRAVFQNAGVGLLLIDKDWKIIETNQRYCEIVGRTRAELAGTNCLEFTVDEDIVRSSEALHAITSGEAEQISFEKRYLGKDGGEIWVRSNLALVSGESDKPRYLKIVEDIGERRRAQHALEDERHKLETLNSIGSALAGELDLERLVQMVTDAGVDLTGAQFGAFFYNVTDDAGESYMLYTLSGADRSQFERFGMPRNTKVFGPTFAGEGIVRSDNIQKDPRYGQNPPHKGQPEGHLPVVSYLAVPVVSRTGEVIGGLFFGHPEPARFTEQHELLMEGIAAQAAIAMDNARLFGEAQREIEQRISAEQALTALNETLESRVVQEVERRSLAEEELRQAQKMETVGQLSGGIAHDFNNLLQIIHGNLTMLQQSLPPDDAKSRRSIANALTGAERAAALTQRLLAFSRRQPLEPKPVDVNRLIGDMTDLLRRTLGETIKVKTELELDTPTALADVNQLENAILNLAINARDAMPDGGHLEVATGVLEVDAGCGQQSRLAPGTYVRISVKDDGVGMSPDVVKRAVEPFFTTKEVGQGTGLGLSMVYGFARQSGGDLALRSVEGQGTTIELFLPRSTAAAHVRAATGPSFLPRGRGETILVCEDDDDVRQFSTETLTELGYNVIEAHEAKAALATLAGAARIDLLFTDIVLPGGKTGADLAREARELRPGLSILLTSGYARSALDHVEVAPAFEMIAKPFSVERLAQRLRQLLD